MIIRDQLNNAPSEEVARVSYALIDRLQHEYEQPGVQVAAAAAFFLLVAERFGVPAQDAFTATKNLMNDRDNRLKHEFQAARAFLREEIRL